MAILQFGSTFRSSYTGFGLTNNSANTVYVAAFGMNIAPKATEFVSLDSFDAYMRCPRHPQVYDYRIAVGGKPALYKDDIADLCAMIQAGTLGVRTTVFLASSGTFSALVSATSSPAFNGTGSSVFYA